jgi:asparagine synthetase B (glutamine-hydrolysing)
MGLWLAMNDGANRNNKRRQSQTDGLTRTFRLAVRRRTHAPMGAAVSDLDSQLIIRVIAL